MYKTNAHRRLCGLEAAVLESQVARLQAHMRSLTRPELDLIIEVSDGQKAGVFLREYTLAEVEFFNSHCDFLASIPDSAHDESTRRTLQELLVKGSIDREEIERRWGREFLPR